MLIKEQTGEDHKEWKSGELRIWMQWKMQQPLALIQMWFPLVLKHMRYKWGGDSDLLTEMY